MCVVCVCDSVLRMHIDARCVCVKDDKDGR